MTSAPRPDPAAQSKYQVRFDWGVAGAERIADGADVVVFVDVLGSRFRALSEATSTAADTRADPVAELLALLPTEAAVLSAGFTTAAAAARWITERQHALGRRAMIAIVAAGGAEAPGIRFAVENQLAAGAIIDALATLGIDYCSPEAAASCAAFTGLRGAVAHLLTASASAQQLVAAGVDAATIRAAGALDTGETPGILRA
ncbi:hypothetical protein [Microterricola gilva]|uniref:hypothetical protein n=1 Tax=Microterricola gilva TaxID=393267 RepID=UPI00102CCCE0|nr:hypothetical protein [Microterricola gilva]